MFRFSLRWLLIFVALVAAGLVSLLCASKLVSDCLSITWFGFLLVSVLGVVYRSQRQRAFWLGCCVFGGSFAAYAHFAQGDTMVDGAVQSLHDAVKWSVLASMDDLRAHNGSGGTAEGPSQGAYRIIFPRFFPFRSESRSLLGIVVAAIGGLIAQWFHATRDGSDRG